jgi:hypothetical protein
MAKLREEASIIEAKARAFDFLVAEARNKEYLRLLEEFLVVNYGYKKTFVRSLLKGLQDYYSGEFDIVADDKDVDKAF